MCFPMNKLKAALRSPHICLCLSPGQSTILRNKMKDDNAGEALEVKLHVVVFF